jgi:hypothetical protein
MENISEIEVERSVLNTALRGEPEEQAQIFSELTRSDFYPEAHKFLFDILTDFFQKYIPFDLPVIGASISKEQKKFLKASDVSALWDDIPAMDLSHCFGILRDRTARRNALNIANAISKAAQDKSNDFAAVVNLAERIKCPECRKVKPTLITLEDVYRDELQDTPIIDGFFYEDEPTVIFADGGVGKSLLMQDVSMHLGAGLASLWGLFKIPRYRLTLFIQSENSRKALQARARKKIRGNEEMLGGILNVFYFGANNSVQASGAISDKDFRQSIIDYAKAIEDETREKIGLICFDPLISFHDGDENDNAQMRRTLDLIGETACIISATPFVLHHANKENGLRGATAIRDWSRILIKMESIGPQSARKLLVSNIKNNNHELFIPFVLEMDDNLNFAARHQAESLPQKKAERAFQVVEALSKLGGRAETQDALIEQYRTDTQIKSDTTAQDHINLAEKNGLIVSESYREGKITKKRYKLPAKKGWFSKPDF